MLPLVNKIANLLSTSSSKINPLLVSLESAVRRNIPRENNNEYLDDNADDLPIDLQQYLKPKVKTLTEVNQGTTCGPGLDKIYDMNDWRIVDN